MSNISNSLYYRSKCGIIIAYGNEQKKPPLTSTQRRALGHLDFRIGFTAFVMSATANIQSLLVNNPQWAEVLNVSSFVGFAVALLGFVFMGYNFSKSTSSPKK